MVLLEVLPAFCNFEIINLGDTACYHHCIWPVFLLSVTIIAGDVFYPTFGVRFRR